MLLGSLQARNRTSGDNKLDEYSGEQIWKIYNRWHPDVAAISATLELHLWHSCQSLTSHSLKLIT